MSGVGEAGAIVSLISTSAKLTQTIASLALKYKHAKAQIKTFGNDVQTLGLVLGQLQRLLTRRKPNMDHEVLKVVKDTVSHCQALFSEIDSFCNSLYSNDSDTKQVNFRGKTKWVLEAAELQVLQARIDSTKMNILLLLTLECLPKDERYVRSVKTILMS